MMVGVALGIVSARPLATAGRDRCARVDVKRRIEVVHRQRGAVTSVTPCLSQ
jgi:hypothetical protein